MAGRLLSSTISWRLLMRAWAMPIWPRHILKSPLLHHRKPAALARRLMCTDRRSSIIAGWRLASSAEPAEAADIFDSLIKSGQEALLASDSGRPDYFAKFGERETKEARMAQGHYILALGYLGSGQRQEAKTELQQAVKLNVNHLDAQFQLQSLSD